MSYENCDLKNYCGAYGDVISTQDTHEYTKWYQLALNYHHWQPFLRVCLIRAHFSI